MRVKREQIRRALVLILAVAGLTICADPVLAQTPPLRANGKIAFTSNRDGNPEIYLMNPDGTNQTRVTNNSIVDDHAMWSPDGNKLAFVSQRAAGGFAIFQMNMDGTNRVEITPLSNFLNGVPVGGVGFSMSWSPDGRKIAFQDPYYDDIWVVDVETRVRQNLTNDGGGQIARYDYHPAWSPDGTTILYASPRFNGSCPGLYTINPDGTNRRLVVPCQAFSPSWSPDGTKIVFVQNGDSLESELDLVNSDGTGFRNFDGNYDGKYRGYPRWSPDGQRIVFNMTTFMASFDIEIFVKNVDGTGYAQLTNTSAAQNYRPSWQPLAPGACSYANPIDCPDFFIGQQYRDFLNREAEPAGLQFYLDLLNGCHPSDVECIRYVRGVLSGNFFRSPEFQRKGNFVMYLYMVSIGQRPVTAAELHLKNDPNLNDRPNYEEFVADLASISTPNDDPALTEQKKNDLANNWMTRSQIVSIYGGLSNAQFVQKLIDVSGVTPANQNWVADLDAGTKTRAHVLRLFAESPEVDAKFFKQSFVTMEYFGYLRRKPEDCHDPANWGGSDPSQCGFIFHNARFNLHPDPHVIQNIIVRGFIESPEYRRRFESN